jgi:predicted AAA+ superfamily ATPase
LDKKMLERPDIISQIDLFFEVMPICGILGPRQVGKTTLAELYSKKFTNCHRFDLEDPYDLALLRNPKASLADLKGLIIIDEIQRLPELFPYLRVFVDRNPDIKILILGSSAPSLLRQSSETLAGRIGYIELTPFDLLTGGDQPRLFTRGGFPKSYLANTWDASSRWRKSYINTFLEQDLAALGFDITRKT